MKGVDMTHVSAVGYGRTRAGAAKRRVRVNGHG